MIRWTCTVCARYVLGPQRAAKDALCRICLDCSAAQQRIVSRAPYAQQARVAQAAKARAARQTAKARTAKAREAARFEVDGLDLRTELRRIARKLGHPVPELVVRRGRISGGTGHAYPSTNRITMTLLPKSSAERALALLVHEFAHLLPGSIVETARGRRDVHGLPFERACTRIVNEVYAGDLARSDSTDGSRELPRRGSGARTAARSPS